MRKKEIELTDRSVADPGNGEGHPTQTRRHRESSTPSPAVIADSVPALISYVGKDHRYKYVNRAYEEWFGRDAAEIVGRHLRDVLGEDVYASVRPEIDRALSGETLSFTRRLNYRDGEPRFVRINYIPDVVSNGEAAGFVAFVVDVTAEQEGERRLASSDERYRAFIANSSEGIWRLELDEPIPTDLPIEEQIRLAFERGYLAECNDAMARQYGFASAGDIIGARVADLLVPSDPANREFISAFIRSGYRLSNAESHEKNAAGDDVYFSNNFVGTVENGRLVRAWGMQRDITPERASSRAIAYLAAIVESSDDAIISKDLNGFITSWNAAAEKMFGYEAAEAVGNHITMLIPDRLGSEEVEIIRGIRSGRTVDHFETIRRRKDGSEFPISLTVSPIRDAGGTIIGASKIARDITERRKAEEIAERYRLLSERAKDIIWILRPNGDLLEVNHAAVTAYGYTREEMLHMNIRDLRAPSTHVTLAEHLRKAAAGSTNFETIHMRRDGSTFPVEVSAGAGSFGSENLIYAIVRDITERKKNEDALAHNQILLSMALHGSRTGVWERDLKADTVWWSMELEELFGLKPGEFRGNEQHFYELMHEDDREDVWSEVETAIVEQRPYVVEFRFYHSDGSIRWMEGRGQAVYSTAGEPIRIYGTGMDITERKLRELNKEFLAEMSAYLSG